MIWERAAVQDAALFFAADTIFSAVGDLPDQNARASYPLCPNRLARGSLKWLPLFVWADESGVFGTVTFLSMERGSKP